MYSACGRFTKNRERIKKFLKIGDSRYICKNELGKACFEHDMTYENFKDLARGIALRVKTFNIGKKSKWISIWTCFNSL